MAKEDGDLTVDVLIEVPMGTKHKYEYDAKYNRLRLDRVLFTPAVYPANYGYIPDTLAPDGDALDVLVLTNDPVIPGCLVTARVLGLLPMHDAGIEDYKILAVEHTDPTMIHFRRLEDVSPNLLRQIEMFLSTYKDLEGGKTSVEAWKDGATASDLISRCREAFVEHHKPNLPRHS